MNIIKANILPLAFGLIGLLLVAFGIFQLVLKSEPKTPALTEENTNAEAEPQILVDVEGAVINPGVYKLSFGAHTVDALSAAGGLSEDANRHFVEKNINLAEKVADGLKLYIPRTGEQILSESVGSNGPVININSASLSELDSLPGIGQITGFFALF